MTAPTSTVPLCRECRAEMMMAKGDALVCSRSPNTHPTRVMITDETRRACEDRGHDWAAATNWTMTKTGPVGGLK